MSTTKPVTSEEADAFMRRYLARPTDVTARLVFADWLEETCKPHNLAWAYYIRLRAEAERHDPDSAERRALDRQADAYAPKVRARLTIPASLFVGYPKSLLQLLPAPNITVRLANFEIPPPVYEFMPESVARENQLVPLAAQGRVMLIAGADPHNSDTARKLEFILNRDVILVGAEEDDIEDAIDQHYGLTELESIDSPPLIMEFTTTQLYALTTEAEPVPEPDPAESQIVRLVNLLFVEAITRRADAVQLVPHPHALVVSYLIDGAWVERDHVPLRLARAVVSRIATMAWLWPDAVLTHPPTAIHRGQFHLNAHGVRLRADVTMTTAPDCPSIHVALAREPVSVADL
jgi:uncharacterized protein (TIGR02996 family)